MNNIVLNIGGSERTFYFGLGFLGNLLDKTGVGISGIDAAISENPFKWMPEIMYHSLSYGYLRKNESMDFDLFDVCDWIENEGGLANDNVKLFFKAFRNSLTKDVPTDPDNKKKTLKK